MWQSETVISLFIENIEREIAAVERGECSPLIEEYLTEEERSFKDSL